LEIAETPKPPKARLGRALLDGLRLLWERLGLALAMSLTWTLLLLLALWGGALLPATLPSGLRFLLTGVILLLVLAGPTVGAFHLAFLVGAREEAGYLDLWRGAGRLWRSALSLAAVHALVIGGLLLVFAFYLSFKGLLAGIAAMVCLYALLFWGMMALYHFPLLAAQEAGVFDEAGRPARRGLLAVFRRAFYLAFGAPFFTLGLGLCLLLLTVPMLLTGAPFALLWLGTVTLLTTQATRALLVQFNVLPPPPKPEALPDEAFRIP
jgi:hypothetical protein